MAEATPRQFEIAKIASRRAFPTKRALATEIERYTKNEISENRRTAFQRLENDEYKALTATTISKYLTVAQDIGILDQNLTPTGKVTESTPFRGFVNHLRQAVQNFSRASNFWIDDIERAISGSIQDASIGRQAMLPPTSREVRRRLEVTVGDMVFNETLKLMSELFSNRIRFTSVQLIQTNSSFWMK